MRVLSVLAELSRFLSVWAGFQMVSSQIVFGFSCGFVLFLVASIGFYKGFRNASVPLSPALRPNID